jgi:hypothetical protein
MVGWALSIAIAVSLVAVGLGALAAPRRWAVMYGIVLDDERAVALIRAMGVRDLVIGGLLVLIALQGRRVPLGWGLCLTAVVALVDYVVVTADRRAAIAGAQARPTTDTRAVHALGAVGVVIAAGLLFAGY